MEQLMKHWSNMIILLPVVIFSSFLYKRPSLPSFNPFKNPPSLFSVSLLPLLHHVVSYSLSFIPLISLSLSSSPHLCFFFFLAKHEKKEFDEMFKKLSTHTERESEMARGWCDRVEKGRTRGKKTIRKTENKCWQFVILG